MREVSWRGEGVAVGEEWLRVPVGADAERWVTRGDVRTVLFVVHNVTSATRLLDVLPLFDGEWGVQCLATCTGSSPFLAGVPELLAGAGLPVLPWAQAKEMAVDLVVSASYGGELHALRGKLTVLSHGVGYNKRLATPGNGTPVAPVFGLDPQWLLHDGAPLASATVLSHPEQLERLRRSCPEAAGTAVLAGDPCFDRMLASRAARPALRRGFGVADGQRLVVLNSTWGPRSLFGQVELGRLIDRLTALPVDEYRLCAVLHPNIWYGHGPGQVRRWLRYAQAAGLTLIDPLGPWRQAVVAADCLIGDHGSVTFYAAALGVPVLLGAFPEQDLDPRSPVAELGRAAPRLLPHEPLRQQLESVMEGHRPERYAPVTAQVTSCPGESARRLRALFHRLLRLPEPARPALLERLPVPEDTGQAIEVPLRVLTSARGGEDGGPPEVIVARYASTAVEPEERQADDAHTVVPVDTCDTGRLPAAELVVTYRPLHPRAWAAEALAEHPYAAMAVAVTGVGRCLTRTREGLVRELTARPGADGFPDPCDPAAYASALYALSGPTAATGGRMVVVTGRSRHHVDIGAGH
ncbi:hypothetical protein ACLGI4_22425 [Streptomyces sp. HMX112]|uniref:hypothetical protein n=1 Tax=Streptomyces sp. HMX112 TaxID=3390850 RepID=UPI003A80264B